MSNAQPSYSRPLLILAGLLSIPLMAIIALFAAVGWGLMTGHVADTKVLPGGKLPPRITKIVSASAGLAQDERILFFYSSAMTPEGDGNLLTDRRVVSYVADGTDTWCDSIALDEVESVDFIQSDSWLEDSTIVIVSTDGYELTLYASNEGGGDVRFVDAIRRAAKLDLD
ncbi:hypothetical protein [Rhodopirellula bahusiensis]|nr:hypothetical protein [Rhodopirellula bahusiensis]